MKWNLIAELCGCRRQRVNSRGRPDSNSRTDVCFGIVALPQAKFASQQAEKSFLHLPHLPWRSGRTQAGRRFDCDIKYTIQCETAAHALNAMNFKKASSQRTHTRMSVIFSIRMLILIEGKRRLRSRTFLFTDGPAKTNKRLANRRVKAIENSTHNQPVDR